MKIVASITAHESELALLDQCYNYFCVGYVDVVVVHANPHSRFSSTLFLRLAQASPFAHRIFLNNFNTAEQAIAGYKLSNTVLHRAHIANFQYIDALMEFDYMCLDASNTLLVKPGLRDLVARGEIVSQQGISDGWMWTPDIRSDAAPAFFGDNLCHGQHEGTVYSRASLALMTREVYAYERALNEHVGRGGRYGDFPREEVILPSAYHRAVGMAPNQEPYLYMSWERDPNLSWSAAQVEDLLQGRDALPETKYSIKRIPRDMNDPARVAIGNHFGYRRAIAEVVDSLKRPAAA